MTRLQDKLTGEQISKSLDSMVRSRWWKLMEEFWREEVLRLWVDILLGGSVINGKRVPFTEAWLSLARKELNNIRRLLSMPHSKILVDKDDWQKDDLEEEDAEDIMADVLSPV